VARGHGGLVGYTNRDKRLVTVDKREKRVVRHLRRRAEKRALKEEHERGAGRATKRGWWYA
jgi:hypothetical protein